MSRKKYMNNRNPGFVRHESKSNSFPLLSPVQSNPFVNSATVRTHVFVFVVKGVRSRQRWKKWLGSRYNRKETRCFSSLSLSQQSSFLSGIRSNSIIHKNYPSFFRLVCTEKRAVLHVRCPYSITKVFCCRTV